MSCCRSKNRSPREDGHLSGELEHVDVVVVGAGVSGLACARSLLEASLNVAIFEGRDRIGGRMFSTLEGAYLGPSWIWPDDSRVLTIAKQFRLDVRPQWLHGEALKQEDDNQVRRVGHCSGRIAPCGPDALRIQGGYARIPFEIAAGLPSHALRLEHMVYSIEDVSHDIGRQAIRVSYRNACSKEGAIIAKYVVLAAPPGVVAKSVTFAPSLPEQQQRFMQGTPTWAGDWAKVVAIFKTPVWRNADLSGVSASECGPISVWWEDGAGPEHGEPYSLGGFAFAHAATALAEHPHDISASKSSVVEKLVTKQLSQMFGDAVREQILEVHHKVWAADPLTHSFTNQSRGDPRRMYGNANLQKSTTWGVHFAGTETEPESGHVEGALKAAERVSKEILSSLK